MVIDALGVNFSPTQSAAIVLQSVKAPFVTLQLHPTLGCNPRTTSKTIQRGRECYTTRLKTRMSVLKKLTAQDDDVSIARYVAIANTM